MARFQYKALQADGRVVEGELEAGGRQEAFHQIESRGLRPIRLVQQTDGTNGRAQLRSKGNGHSRPEPAAAASAARPASWRLPWSRSRKVSARALENFTRLLSSLLAAGVPLSRALVILQKETAHPAAREKWKEIHDRVVDGMSLADAMAQLPDVFPRVYVAMVEAGETGGFLDLVLAQIADFQSREKEMRARLMSALLYPAILLLLALGVLVFLLVYFIPRFTTLFAGFGGQLPALTRAIVAVSDVVRSYGVLVLGVGVVTGVMLRQWLVSPAGRRMWEGFILKVPVLGRLVAQYAMARFCRMLGTLLAAGVPLIQGLQVARRSLGNQILVDAVAGSIDRVKEGQGLGNSLRDCPMLFPGSVLEMITVAEESGRLDQELTRIANTTEADLDRQLKLAVSMAEPLMLFFIAGFIGIIFIGMVLPIFSLQDYIR
ncbi:type II secretion system F family protein [Limisphaera ngatamarikiensis]|uniref:General secretion pathway protein F n=1 Tax=Limisphaera ngatamarikiensis TaxID=1324935 RepID=A0A6M1RH69_9BACT|nr:type II secretion system F family protein [Limisphaera ngatamarikiensis]NGO39408.1 type II secretion system F family protein [Limisphaera ngatamarikiensis]